MTSSHTYVIVGHGRMAAALRASLKATSPKLTVVSARKAASGALRRPSVGRLVWVLAVPDRYIIPVATGLLDALRPRDVVLHLAGMLGPEVLAHTRERGAAVASMHPLAAVAAVTSRASLEGTTFLVEGDRLAETAARTIARAVNGRLITARVTDRARYHGAAALVATGSVALAQGAAWMLAGALATPPAEADVRAAIASLLRSVARNVESVGVRKALASPLLRNDTSAVARHLAAMSDDPTVRALYAAAITRVLEPLEAGELVSPETIAAARKLVAT